MLVLNRKLGTTICIGDDITITVLGIREGEVRVGINAPREIAVHRQEVYERIQREHDLKIAAALEKELSST